jgi:O-antigen/teichoic acid export membrane protein
MRLHAGAIVVFTILGVAAIAVGWLVLGLAKPDLAPFESGVQVLFRILAAVLVLAGTVGLIGSIPSGEGESKNSLVSAGYGVVCVLAGVILVSPGNWAAALGLGVLAAGGSIVAALTCRREEKGERKS